MTSITVHPRYTPPGWLWFLIMLSIFAVFTLTNNTKAQEPSPSTATIILDFADVPTILNILYFITFMENRGGHIHPVPPHRQEEPERVCATADEPGARPIGFQHYPPKASTLFCAISAVKMLEKEVVRKFACASVNRIEAYHAGTKLYCIKAEQERKYA